MRTIRTRILAADYVEVERKDGITIVRWDAQKETVTTEAPKKGRRKSEEPGEPITKETGYLVCTESAYFGEVTAKIVQKDIDADIASRYPTGDAPKIKASVILGK